MKVTKKPKLNKRDYEILVEILDYFLQREMIIFSFRFKEGELELIDKIKRIKNNESNSKSRVKTAN